MIDDEIRDLIARRSESQQLDYKEGFAWTAENRDKKYELVKDLVALANTKDGGRIVLGVRDGDFEFIGVDDDVYLSLDPNNVVQMLHACAAPKVKCEVIKREIDGRKVVLFDVGEFDDTPIICIDTINGRDQRPILRKGAIYLRTRSAATAEVMSPDEMRELLGRAMVRKGDELLRTIERLITGKTMTPVPTAVALYEREIEPARSFMLQHLGEDLAVHGWTEVVTYPADYQERRIPSIPEVRELLSRSEVSIRGWNFPHLDRDNLTAFGSGIQSWTSWERYREAFRLHQSGLFVWRRAFAEDLVGYRSDAGNRALSFISEIYSFVEYVTFVRRLYEAMVPEGSVHVRISLNGCADRELVAMDAMIPFWDGHVARDDSIVIEEDLRIVEVRAALLDIAARMVKRVFHVFNWLDVADETIAHWQRRLLERR